MNPNQAATDDGLGEQYLSEDNTIHIIEEDEDEGHTLIYDDDAVQGAAKKQKIFDVMGAGGAAGGPDIIDPVTKLPVLNIDDPLYADRWETDPKITIALGIDDTPNTCWDNCREKAVVRAKNCALVRKRVAIALKQGGCPSKVLPLKVAGPCGYRAKKTSDTATTSASKRWRRR